MQRYNIFLKHANLFAKIAGSFFSKYSPDEIIDAGIDGKIAVFVLGCDRIRLAFELFVETGFVGVKECLFLGRKGRLVLEGVNELLREMGSITESGHVSPLAGKDGVRIIVAGLRGIGLQTADFSDITVVVMCPCPSCLVRLQRQVGL